MALPRYIPHYTVEDFLITCGHNPSDFVEETPVLIVEVLSESTRQRDLLYKREMYEQHGVKYYILADPKSRNTQILFNIEEGFETSQGPLRLSDGCSLEADLSGIYS